MGKILDTIIGDFKEKKKYRDNEKRAKTLPAEYAEAYRNIKHYLWNTSGILTIDPLVSLVDLLEEAAANGKHLVDITGPDIAAFADEFVRGEKSYFDSQRKKLNASLTNKSEK